MRKLLLYTLLLSLLLLTPDRQNAQNSIESPLTVSLGCPASPASSGTHEETTTVTVAPGTLNFSETSITFPDIYSSLPPGTTTSLTLTTTITAFGVSLLSEVSIDIDGPGTFADQTGYAPSASTPGTGPATYTLDLGTNDPTGIWDFTVIESLNDSGNDSEVTFVLTLTYNIPAMPSDCDTTVCQGNSIVLDPQLTGSQYTYNWSTNETSPNITVTENGTYTVTVSNGTETSTDEINVTFNSTFEENDVVLCQGESITIGSNTYTTTGIYTDNLNTWQGCDSLIITNLTVYDVNTTDIFPEICDGDSFTVGTSTYTTTGDYTDVLTSTYSGCDSIVNTHLTVNTEIVVNEDIHICQGESHTVGTSVYTQTGNYSDMFTSSLGCDSIINTNLIVHDNYNINNDVEICAGDTYTVGSSTYDVSGQYTDMLQSYFGCDSIIVTNLTVNDTFYIEQTVSICQGESYTIGNNTYTQSGVFTDVLSSINQCDSTVVTTLIINDPVTVDIFPEICDGGAVVVGTSTYSTAGDYTDVLSSVITGCDSIVNTHLTVNTQIVINEEVHICQGESHTVGTSIYTQTGNYSDSFISSLGCDSIVNTNLIVHDVYNINQDVEICQGESYTVGTSTYDQAGTYTDLLSSMYGCDSTVVTNLIINDTFYIEQTVSICQGENYTIGNNTYSQAGNYTDVLSSIDGCDSTVLTTLIINDPVTVDIFPQICNGGSFVIGTSTYTTEGDYTDVLSSVVTGCDSIVNTHLTVVSQIVMDETVHLCQGESHTVGNNTYTQAGNYTDTFISSLGCDSIVNTEIFVHDDYTINQDVEICQGESFTVGTSTYNQAGTYTDLLSSIYGCDSTVVTNLIVNDTFYVVNNVQICIGDTYTVGANTYTQTGTYTDVLATVNNCDSTVITNLVVQDGTAVDIFPQICNGGTFTIGNSTYTQSGTYTDVLVSSIGCDSVVTTHLQVVNEIVVNQDVSICAGESITVGNSIYSVEGDYTDTFTSSLGCDSIVHTHVEVLEPSSEQDVEICGGETFTVGNSTYSQSGTYTDVLNSVNGCDSIVTTNLTVLTNIQSQQDVFLCSGQMYTIGTSTYTISGVYTDVLVSSIGCDSTVTTNLTIADNLMISNDVYICQGESYTVGNNTYFLSGTYNDIITSSSGCDSIVETNLFVVDPVQTSIDVELCMGAMYEGEVYTQDETFTVTETGYLGCDSLVITHIIIVDPFEISINVENDNCGSGSGYIQAAPLAGVSPYTYAWSNNVFTALNSNLEAGIYTITITDATGCTSTAETTVDESPSVQADYIYSDITCHNDNDGWIDLVVLQGTPPYSFMWTGPNGFSATTEDLTDLEEGFYSVLIFDANNCGFGTSVEITNPEALSVDVITYPDHGNNDGVAVASVSGGTAPYSFFWSNNRYDASIDGLEEGTYAVTVTDANGCTSVADGVVNFTVNNQEITDMVSFNISPIPNDGLFEISWENIKSGDWTAEIYDLNGKKIYANQWLNTSTVREQIDLRATVSAGTYLFTLQKDKERITRKIIIH